VVIRNMFTPASLSGHLPLLCPRLPYVMLVGHAPLEVILSLHPGGEVVVTSLRVDHNSHILWPLSAKPAPFCSPVMYN
jgi:hypothetical protein